MIKKVYAISNELASVEDEKLEEICLDIVSKWSVDSEIAINQMEAKIDLNESSLSYHIKTGDYTCTFASKCDIHDGDMKLKADPEGLIDLLSVFLKDIDLLLLTIEGSIEDFKELSIEFCDFKTSIFSIIYNANIDPKLH